MTTLRTPPLNATGTYELIQPWVAKPTHIYSCIAIRRFDELLIEHEDIYDKYYRPMGLVPSTYESDLSAGASLITLISDKGEVIDVPDTFIKSFPDMNLSDYKRIILSMDLGALPGFFDVAHVRSKITQVTEAALGRAPIVNLHSAPLRNPLSKEKADQAEKVRASSIADKQSTQATLANWEKQRTDLNLSITRLTNYSKKLEGELNDARLGATQQVTQLQTQLTEKERTIATLSQEKTALVRTQQQELDKLKATAKADLDEVKRLYVEKENEYKAEIERLKTQISTQTLPEEIKNADTLKDHLLRKRDEYHLSSVQL